MAERVVVVLPIKAAEGKGDEVIDAFTPCILETVQEEGCLKYALHRESTDPDSFVLVEQWRSQADLDDHLQKPHITALVEAMSAPGLLAGAPTITFLSAVGLGGDKGTL